MELEQRAGSAQLGVPVVVPNTQSEFWTTSDLLPSRVPARAALAPFRCSTKYKPALSSVTAHSCWQQQLLHPSGVLPHRARGAKVGPLHGPGYTVGWSWETGQSPGKSQSADSALIGEQGNMYVNFTSEPKFS